MATVTVTKGYNDPTGFTSGETITPAKLNSAQSPTVIVSNIVNADIDAAADIGGSKLADGGVTPAKLSQPLTLATAQATTSGTSIDFTGIPSWVKRITVMLDGVSTSGTSGIRFQLIVGGLPVTTNYTTAAFVITNAVASVPSTFTDGWGFPVANALSVQQGQIVINKLSSTSWTGAGQFYDNLSVARIAVVAGRAFSVGTVEGLRLTTTGGTDTFDAGSVNIMYEG